MQLDPICCRVMARLDDEILANPRRWGRNRMFDAKTGRYCLLGGLRSAVVEETQGDHRPVYRTLQNILKRQIADKYPRNDSYPVVSITSFNDNPRIHFKDVKAVVRAVRAEVCDD